MLAWFLSIHLEDSDVPSVALHGLLKFATFQALLGSNTMQVLVEVQTWTQINVNYKTGTSNKQTHFVSSCSLQCKVTRRKHILDKAALAPYKVLH